MRKFGVVLGPYRFEIPWIFFDGRPRANLPSCEFHKDKLAIQFRFKGKFLDESGDVDHSFDGSDLDIFKYSDLIKVQAIQFYKITPELYSDPANRHRNTIRAMTPAGSVRKINGLEEIRLGWAAGEGTDWYLNEEKTEAFISCGFVTLCTGFLNLRDLRLTAHITLKEEAIGEVRAIIVALRSLLSEWRTYPLGAAK